MENREERKRLLMRENQGRLERPAFLTAISEALGVEVAASQLISLPETDEMLEIYQGAYELAIEENGSCVKLFPGSGSAEMHRLVDCLANALEAEPAYFFTPATHHCGALQVEVSLLLKNVDAILKLDGDWLRALSVDRSQGLVVDYIPDDEEQMFEVTAWGDRWCSQFKRCTSDEQS